MMYVCYKKEEDKVLYLSDPDKDIWVTVENDHMIRRFKTIKDVYDEEKSKDCFVIKEIIAMKRDYHHMTNEITELMDTFLIDRIKECKYEARNYIDDTPFNNTNHLIRHPGATRGYIVTDKDNLITEINMHMDSIGIYNNVSEMINELNYQFLGSKLRYIIDKEPIRAGDIVINIMDGVKYCVDGVNKKHRNVYHLINGELNKVTPREMIMKIPRTNKSFSARPRKELIDVNSVGYVKGVMIDEQQ